MARLARLRFCDAWKKYEENYHNPWVENMGRRLMIKHGLAKWTLTVKPQDPESTLMGQCCSCEKRVILFTEWTQSIYVLRCVMLHEIAHALARRAGHGPKFQTIARKIGVPPTYIKPLVKFKKAPIPDDVEFLTTYQALVINKNNELAQWRAQYHT